MKSKSLVLCFVLLFNSHYSVSVSLTEYFTTPLTPTECGLIGVATILCACIAITLYANVIFNKMIGKFILYCCSKNKLTLLGPLLRISFFKDYMHWQANEVVPEIQVNGYSFPLMKAAYDNKNDTLFQFLVDRGGSISPQILLGACSRDDIPLIKACFKANCDVNEARNTRGCMHSYRSYCNYCSDAIHCACDHGSKQVVELLLSKGISSNDESKIGTFPLTLALGSLEGITIAPWLIEQGATKYSLGGLLFILAWCSSEKRCKEQKDRIVKALEIIIDLLISEKITFQLQHYYGVYTFVRIEQYYKQGSWSSDEQREIKLLMGVECLMYVFKAMTEIKKSDVDAYKKLISMILQKEELKKCYGDFLLFQDDAQELPTLFSKEISFLNYALELHKDNIVTEHFNPFFIDDRGDTCLHYAARRSVSLLNALIKKCTDEDLSKLLMHANNQNKTVFYVGHEAKVIKDIKDIECMRHINVSDFLYRELCTVVTVLEHSHIFSFVEWCVNNGVDLNKKNEKKMRPVDIAIKLHEEAANVSAWDSECFIAKERIMHAFLYHTPHTEDDELRQLFLDFTALRGITTEKKCLPNEVIDLILHYHHINTIDHIIAKRVISSGNMAYYQKTKQQKLAFKNQIIEDERIQVDHEYALAQKKAKLSLTNQ